MAFKTELTMGAQEVRLSLNAKDGASVWDAPGYAVYLYGADNRVQIRRNNSCLQESSPCLSDDPCHFACSVLLSSCASRKRRKRIASSLLDVFPTRETHT